MTVEQDVKDWILVYVGGVLCVGKLNSGSLEDRLDPVFHFKPNLVPLDQSGKNVGVVHTCEPLALLPSLTDLVIPENVWRKPVSQLSTADQRKVLNAIASGEKTAQAIRAADSGITLARG